MTGMSSDIDDNHYEDFGTTLNEICQLRKMSQKTLAIKLNISRQTVSSWIHGRSKPRKPILIHTISVLQIDESTQQKLFSSLGYRDFNTIIIEKKDSSEILEFLDKKMLMQNLKDWILIYRGLNKLMPLILILEKEFENISQINQSFINKSYDRWFNIHRMYFRGVKNNLDLLNTQNSVIHDEILKFFSDKPEGLDFFFKRLSKLNIENNIHNKKLSLAYCIEISRIIHSLVITFNKGVFISIQKIDEIASIIVNKD